MAILVCRLRHKTSRGLRLALHCSRQLAWTALTRQIPPLGVSKSCYTAADQACDRRPSACVVESTTSADSFSPIRLQSRCSSWHLKILVYAVDFTNTDPSRGRLLHDRPLETSSAPTQHHASCLRHVRSSSAVVSHCRILPRSS